MSAHQERLTPRMSDAEYEQAVVAQLLREQQQYAQVLARKLAVSQEAADKGEGEVQDEVSATKSEQVASVGHIDMSHDRPSAARQDPTEQVSYSGTA